MATALSEVHDSGTSPGCGTFVCVHCEAHIFVSELEPLPDCPHCGPTRYSRASLFDYDSESLHRQQTREFQADAALGPPEWLGAARQSLSGAGPSLAFMDQRLRTVTLPLGWTRIGRSPGADLRLNDPSVSRRHALIIREPDAPARILDDRSLNGVLRNGRAVQWSALADGDELRIGRFRLFLIDA